MRSSSRLPERRFHRGGFSLLEVLITLGIVMAVLVALLQFVGDVGRVWKATARDPFAEAEGAFEVVAQNLSGATLENYWDYADSSGAFRVSPAGPFHPDHLARRSDLDFVCEPAAAPNGPLQAAGRIATGSAVFFLAPRGYTQTCAHEGMDHLLNALGYFVEFGDGDAGPAFFSRTPRLRWRLKQVMQPAESLQVFSAGSPSAWISRAIGPGETTPFLAENIVTLLVVPERAVNDGGEPLSADFRYDSRDAAHPVTRHQLPPRVRLVLVAMDEASAQRLAARYGSSPPPLVLRDLFLDAAPSRLDADLALLDESLAAQKIDHRILQRHIALSSAAWSETGTR